MDSGGGPLTPEQRREVEEAAQRARKFLAAARVATFNGWTIGLFAALSLLFGFSSLRVLVLGVGMAVVAWNEFRGRRMLRDFDPAGLRLLGRNQVGFMGVIILYCLWSMYAAAHGHGIDLGQIEDVIGPTEDLVRTLTLTVYGAVIAATILFQGLNARYYFARMRMLEAYLAETPPWIVDLQRATRTE